jgi:hypothetical protein
MQCRRHLSGNAPTLFQKAQANVEAERLKEHERIRDLSKPEIELTALPIGAVPQRISSMPRSSSVPSVPSMLRSRAPRSRSSLTITTEFTRSGSVPAPAPLHILHANTHRAMRPPDPKFAIQEVSARECAITRLQGTSSEGIQPNAMCAPTSPLVLKRFQDATLKL